MEIVSHRRADYLLIAHSQAGSAQIERWRVAPVKRLGSVRTPESLHQLIVVGQTLVVASQHTLFSGPVDLSRVPRRRWRSAQTILKLTPFRTGWLVLTADPSPDGHPKNGQVTWFPHSASQRPRLLSLRSVYNFWDVQVGDVDGDGRSDIALCTWSKTRYIHSYARRYFVYGMAAQDVFPRWRGSRLSKPYLSARLVRAGSGKDWKLLSVEQTSSHRVCLMLYQWDDFGFFGLGRSRELSAARIIPNPSGIPIVGIPEANGEQLGEVVFSGGKLTIQPIARGKDRTLEKNTQVCAGRLHARGYCALILPGGKTDHLRIYRLPVQPHRGPSFRSSGI